MANVLFSSSSTEWVTPQYLFDYLNRIFNFEVDAAATKENTKCPIFFDKETNGLYQKWDKTTWCNPPYDRNLFAWVYHAEKNHYWHNNTIVMLIPARTDTKYFHYAVKHGAKIVFIKGRLKFSNSNNYAPFPSMLVIFDMQNYRNLPNMSILDLNAIRRECND